MREIKYNILWRKDPVIRVCRMAKLENVQWLWSGNTPSHESRHGGERTLPKGATRSDVHLTEAFRFTCAQPQAVPVLVDTDNAVGLTNNITRSPWVEGRSH